MFVIDDAVAEAEAIVVSIPTNEGESNHGDTEAAHSRARSAASNVFAGSLSQLERSQPPNRKSPSLLTPLLHLFVPSVIILYLTIFCIGDM